MGTEGKAKWYVGVRPRTATSEGISRHNERRTEPASPRPAARIDAHPHNTLQNWTLEIFTDEKN